jgi:hypothetical protein
MVILRGVRYSGNTKEGDPAGSQRTLFLGITMTTHFVPPAVLAVKTRADKGDGYLLPSPLYVDVEAAGVPVAIETRDWADADPASRLRGNPATGRRPDVRFRLRGGAVWEAGVRHLREAFERCCFWTATGEDPTNWNDEEMRSMFVVRVRGHVARGRFGGVVRAMHDAAMRSALW